MPSHYDDSLYSSLQELNVIPQNDLKDAFDAAKSENRDFYELLSERDLISDENLGKLIADTLKVPFIKLSDVNIPDQVLHIIPEVVAKKHYIIPFEKNQDSLKLAMNNPSDQEIQSFILKKSGEKNVKVYFATKKDIEEAFGLYKKDIDEVFKRLLSQTGDLPISEIVDNLIDYAYRNKASDIHIEPEEEKALVRFRIDGVLHYILELPKEVHEKVITRIKVMAHLRTDEHQSAQDGKMQVDIENEELDIRVSIVPVIKGEKCVMRLLSSKVRQFSLANLGFGDDELAKVQKAIKKPHGMILATGPTGSGKTTTIYSIIKIVNRPEVNIATIEDPVEYDIERINQIQVNTETNLTFLDGLRAILRQDPNIIFVGEIRDPETASIAVNSAMTGHLVLSTLHTNNAATTLPRLIEMDIDPYLVASTVNVIVAQRLVRKICDNCKVSETIPMDDLKAYFKEDVLFKYLPNSPEVRVYKGKGCEVCHNSGYQGRLGVFEVLEVSPHIADLINNKASANIINEEAIKEGMTPMFEDGLRKIAQGVTTVEEVLRVVME